MDKTQEALKLALEALEDARTELCEWSFDVNREDYNNPRLNDAITAIREALADHIGDVNKMVEQPAQQQELSEKDLSDGLAMALHDAVLIRIGGNDEATKQACIRIDKLVEKYRKEHPNEQPAQQQCRTDGRCQYAIDIEAKLREKNNV